MKILFVWTGLTGYMGDCWRAISKRPGLNLRVAVDLSETHYGGAFRAEDVMRDLDWSGDLPCDWEPDVIFSVGWRNRLCRQAVSMFRDSKKVCCFDMPWEWKMRKVAARFVLWPYLRRFDAAFVPGKKTTTYARWLGFRREQVYPGLFSTNLRRFGTHVGGGGFLYAGRESPEKGLDVLRAAHARYRDNGGTWRLRIVNGVPPDDLGPIFAGADCFVLASRHEPWGVVLVEAAAAGLPIICTDKCGARHEVVKGNGIVVKSGSVEELAKAMKLVESGCVESGERGASVDGELGRELAKPYSCEAWAERVVGICKKLME